MMKTDIKDRFTKYGFWLYSEDDIISACKEKYWSDMFPITDGKLDLNTANDVNLLANEENGTSSSMRIRNRINNFKYTVSFDSKVKLESAPKCEMYNFNSKNFKNVS